MLAPSYRDFIKFRTATNPCILGLDRHLRRQTFNAGTIICIDYPWSESCQSKPKPLAVVEADVGELIRATPSAITRLLLIEDISPRAMCLVGETLDIDPIFFAEYVDTNFEDIEKSPPPPSLAILPSLISDRGDLHLHYQHVLDLGGVDAFADTPYAFKTDSNIPRNVRRLAPLSGKQLALARSCCSILVQNTERHSICLILIDRPVSSVVDSLGTNRQRAYPAKHLHGGFEGFGASASFSSFMRGGNSAVHSWNTRLLGSLAHYYQTQAPPTFHHAPPSALNVGYYPLRIVLAEWNLYTHLTSRYSKYYEYSLRDISNRLHDNDIVELQRWRRRSKQSRRKLTILADFVDHWRQREDNKEPWDRVLRDMSYIQQQLEDYGQSLDHMVTIATSMVQLVDSRRSILEAVNVRRLTYIALVFVPLGWVASLFSMSDAYSPGHERFWVYFATALPLLALVLLLSAFPFELLGQLLKRT